jgi:CHAT domain-containing protein
VDDAVIADLMEVFYKGYVDRTSVAAALGHAQR